MLQKKKNLRGNTQKLSCKQGNGDIKCQEQMSKKLAPQRQKYSHKKKKLKYNMTSNKRVISCFKSLRSKGHVSKA
jgi:adenine specific DNA methylase Mod